MDDSGFRHLFEWTFEDFIPAPPRTIRSHNAPVIEVIDRDAISAPTVYEFLDSGNVSFEEDPAEGVITIRFTQGPTGQIRHSIRLRGGIELESEYEHG